MARSRSGPTSRGSSLVPDTMAGRLALIMVLLAFVTAAIVIGADAALGLLALPMHTLLVSVLMGLTGAAIGTGLAFWLTRGMRTSVVRLVDRVKTQGYLAAEGAPYVTEEVGDPSLPSELRELAAVVEDLLRHLSMRQAELKNAIRDAESAEETLGVVVSESPEVKIVLQDGRVVLANPAAARALERPVDAFLGVTLTAAFVGIAVRCEDRPSITALQLLERALGEPTTIALARAEGPERWYVAQAVRHPDDLHNRILFSARDITEERRLEQIRAEIVSIVSHDLRSPLSVVVGYLDLLRGDLTAEARNRAIDTAQRSAARMADLLEDLLSATRAEELLAPSELSPIPLLLVAEEVVGSLGPTHAERVLRLDQDCSPIVMAEDRRLRQVLVNLVTNAFKYAPETEPIVVKVRCVGSRVRLEVIDHGPGVPESERTRVFERFARVQSTSERPGVGLGLYIVNIIARNHGGFARVEETPGGGATFVVDLPLAGHLVNGDIVLDGAVVADSVRRSERGD